ncbi:hypothetical protein F2Q70_00012572 [Brassica cretica]|uniref:Uncharacterized protein n=1 Tax=Brassica cretica TaxID=69181 RepID=A0A8S9M152_BRACR|nr:hypothetical protein F2Q70_00012572 [Brassica cretica]
MSQSKTREKQLFSNTIENPIHERTCTDEDGELPERKSHIRLMPRDERNSNPASLLRLKDYNSRGRRIRRSKRELVEKRASERWNRRERDALATTTEGGRRRERRETKEKLEATVLCCVPQVT